MYILPFIVYDNHKSKKKKKQKCHVCLVLKDCSLSISISLKSFLRETVKGIRKSPLKCYQMYSGTLNEVDEEQDKGLNV